VTLMHAGRRHVMFKEVIAMTEEPKRQDVTLRHSCQSQRGLGPRSGSSSDGQGAG
jgi:hypothetical protein